MLSAYQMLVERSTGPLTSSSGVWPERHQLTGFESCYASAYQKTNELVAVIETIQEERKGSSA